MPASRRQLRALVACERSGVVRRALRAAGVDAWSADIEPAQDGAAYHWQGDAREALSRGPWDLLIAHPPCTYLCNSGVWALTRTPPNPSPGVLYGAERAQAMYRAAQFFADLYNTDVPHVALENPTMHGHARAHIAEQGVPDCTQTIQPYQFGDDASKQTALWLKSLPALEPAKAVAPRYVCKHCRHTERDETNARRGWNALVCPACSAPAAMRPRWANQTDSGQNKLTPSAERAAQRAETYPGIAEAMADQWTRYILAARPDLYVVPSQQNGAHDGRDSDPRD